MYFKGARSVEQLAIPCEAVSSVPACARAAPRQAYEDQDFSNFDRGLSLYDARRETKSGTVWFPDVTLNMYTLNAARVLVAPALNGVILTRDNLIVEEPSCFRERAISGAGTPMPEVPTHPEIMSAFVGFDRSTANYYHWLLYGLAKSVLAHAQVAPQTAILLPDHSAYLAQAQGHLSESVFSASLRVASLSHRAKQVPYGIYPVEQLSFFWHTPKMPELYLLTPDLYVAFDAMPVSSTLQLPKRFYVSREKSAQPRVTPEEQAQIDAVLSARGVATVHLEDMDFETQVALFRGADLIIAPHGAGLANLVFSPASTSVIELNRQLDGQSHLRNCFYLISAARSHRYAMLDLTQPGLTQAQLHSAIDRVSTGTVAY